MINDNAQHIINVLYEQHLNVLRDFFDLFDPELFEPDIYCNISIWFT